MTEQELQNLVSTQLDLCNKILESGDLPDYLKKLFLSSKRLYEEFLAESKAAEVIGDLPPGHDEDYRDERPHRDDDYEADCDQRAADIRDTQERMKGNW